MKRRTVSNMLRCVILIAILISLPVSASAQVAVEPVTEFKKPTPTGFERWESSIRKFEQRITEGTSKPGGVLFLGSSSIRKWDLGKWFPNQQTVNHGFGGSEVADSLHFFDRIVTPLQPTMIVMYAGDNDIGKGKSAEIVHRDFTQFVNKLRRELGEETRLGFIAIKPSISRWDLSGEMARANQMIAKDCKADDQLVYFDIWTPMLGDDGKPMPDLFEKDGLHLSDKGYEIWTNVINKYLPVAK